MQATKEAKRKRERETAAARGPQQSADVVISRWARSIASDGEVQKMKAEGSFPPHLAYRIPLSMERFPAS